MGTIHELHTRRSVDAVSRQRAAGAGRPESQQAVHPSYGVPDVFHVPESRPAAPRRWARRVRATLIEERGAVTAEYAIVIMAAVAFAGLLVAIMRSSEVRAMLVELVENALNVGG